VPTAAKHWTTHYDSVLTLSAASELSCGDVNDLHLMTG